MYITSLNRYWRGSIQKSFSSPELTGAQLGADGGFQRMNDARGKVIDLHIGECGFATLEGYSHHQRIFPCRDILAAEYIGRLDRSKFGNFQRANRSRDLCEWGSFRQQQRKIA